jgi:hypothetical protein
MCEIFSGQVQRVGNGVDVQHSPSCPVLAIPAEGELKVNAPAVLTLLAAAAVNL